MIWLIWGCVIVLILCIQSTQSGRNDDCLDEEASQDVHPSFPSITAPYHPAQKHFIEKHLHRDDKKHERHKRSQWPL